ncbi:MAG: alanine/glycine:cation symporter family protein [Alphaproteobacteria bacterium]
MSIDEKINQFFEPISKAVEGVILYSVPLVEGQEASLILLWLASIAIFYSLYLGFLNVRYFGYAVKLLFGKGMKKSDDGEISQFQALMTCLSGTVGLGNIAMVGAAIFIGGPGAAFWMTIMGFLGMSSKFAEVMLGVKYRIHPDPENPARTAGGPMYYLRVPFENMGIPVVGSIMAVSFTLFCIIGGIGGGNMLQANQVFAQLVAASGGVDASPVAKYGWAVGLGLAFLVGIVIIGGLKSIAAVSSKIVPFMGVLYVLGGVTIIGLNVEFLPQAISTIISSAFSMEAGIGGVVGGILVGVQRAAFSNEAGLGSAAIVQSTTNTDGPVGTGMVAMLGPFIDTIIVCNITALVIVITGAYSDIATDGGLKAVELTSHAFEMGIPYSQYLLTVCVFFFAFSTMIAWYYNAAICVRYLFGEKDGVELVFKVIYCLCIIVGASAQIDHLFSFADAVFLAMAIPNVLGLYLLAPEVKRDVKGYILKLKSVE